MSFLRGLFGSSRPTRPRPPAPTPSTPDQPAPEPAPADPPAGDVGLPSGVGAFRFPGTGTQGIRLTAGQDTLLPAGMAYWNNINQHAGQGELFVFLGTTSGVRLWRVDKRTLEVERRESFRPGTGEGWYFSKVDPHLLILFDGPRLIRHNILTHQEEELFNVEDRHPGHTIVQPHSNRGETAHSATLVSPDWQRIGTVVYQQGRSGVTYWPQQGLDESHIDKSGRWLMIEEGADNRVIDLETGRESWIPDRAGAINHADMGDGYMVGEENQSDPGGVFRRWNFVPGQDPQDAGPIFSSDWTPMSRYVSHCNAPQPFVLITLAQQLWKAGFDGSRQLVAPTLAAGGGYEQNPKANIDPAGEWACWTTNTGSGGLTALLARIP